MFCGKCGIDVADSPFCKGCGCATANNAQDASQQSNQQQNFAGNQMNAHPEAKSKIVAGILALLIGTLGIHNFYLGFTGKAIAQLLMSTVGILLIFPPFVSWIWSLVEGIQILTGSINVDAKGIPLTE